MFYYSYYWLYGVLNFRVEVFVAFRMDGNSHGIEFRGLSIDIRNAE